MSSFFRHRPEASLPVIVLVTLAYVVPLSAAERVALVIGNADYPSAPLRNPVNDARAMSRALRELGFEVISLENASRQRMEQAIVRFVGKLSKDASGLFYYAGHGVQVDGRNYLVPVDAQIESEREVRIKTVGVNLVLDELGYAGNRMNIVILDACRNNPFERRLRGGSRGLAAIDAARGTLIAYATAPGSVALDGDGANGIYTEELLSSLREPGLEVEEVFKQVRVGVARRTNQQQIPWESSSLIGSFVFNHRPTPSTAKSGVAGGQAELLFWQSVSESGSPDAYRAYLRQFPRGVFADLARIRVEELEVASGGEMLAATAASGSVDPAPATARTKAEISVPDSGETASQAMLVAKIQPAPQASAPAPADTSKEKRPFVIGVIAPSGTIWGKCHEGVDEDAMIKDASKRFLEIGGFTYRPRWYPAAATRSLWIKSGAHTNPNDEKIFAYGQETDVDGVLLLRYEVGGGYCDNVQIETYLYDVGRRIAYREQGALASLASMMEQLIADFAKGRAR